MRESCAESEKSCIFAATNSNYKQMEILSHTPVQSMLFFVLYGITGVVPLLAALYLLLCPVNAIAPGVSPPVRLRRWTAAFFGVTTLAHVWWLLFYIYSGDLQSVWYALLAMLDCVLLFVTFAGMLLAMLQDRRRKVWPALAAVVPFVLLGGAYMVTSFSLLEQISAGYLLLLGLVFTAYMVFAIRQYGRWLNDNYADLENKRVWLCQAVALGCMLLFVLYVLATDIVLIWFIHIIELVIVGLLLWRVESLPQLELPAQPQAQQPTAAPVNIDIDHIEKLLKEYCVAQQIYLQQDLTLEELAQAIGTNRSYLSQYFSRQGYTYNTYINSLRVNHFISLYEQAVAAGQNVGAQQLAEESGFRSYSTFSRAFTQRMGLTVKAWMQGKGE
ncbi:MAG: helix-turn-helix transcriptional regulator [Prevotella sp.]|nr:helix-turn-helix transcriptional regulator [Prevotella sp.]